MRIYSVLVSKVTSCDRHVRLVLVRVYNLVINN